MAVKTVGNTAFLIRQLIVCHISKKTARYLLHTGLVPCKNTGKRTHTYRIRKTAVLKYLLERDIMPEKFTPGKGNYDCAYAKAMSEAEPDLDADNDTENDIAVSDGGVTPDTQTIDEFCIYEEYPDVLSVKQAAFIAGVAPTTVNDWARKKYLKSFMKSGVRHIPKIALIEYLQSPRHRFNCEWTQNQFAKQTHKAAESMRIQYF